MPEGVAAGRLTWRFDDAAADNLTIDEVTMGSRPTAAQWLAVRQLCEGAAPTKALVAQAIHVDVSAIYNRAKAESWRSLDFRFPQVKALQRDLIEAAAVAAGRDGLDGAGSDVQHVAGAQGADGAEALNGCEEQGGQAADGVIEDAPDAVEMMARASRFVSRQILTLMDRADRCGGRLDKGQIDGLVAMSRMMDRWETMARQRQVEDRIKSDEDLAQLLREIDMRIIVLAEAEAQRLCQEGSARQAS